MKNFHRKFHTGVLLLSFIVTGCLKLSAPTNESSASPNISSKNNDNQNKKTKTAIDYEREWIESGVVDLRPQRQFILQGEYSDKLLRETTITIWGEDRVVLRSAQAQSFTYSSNVTLTGSKFNYFRVQESNNGKTIYTRFDNNGDSIKYNLTLR